MSVVVPAFAGRKNVRRRRVSQIECDGECAGTSREYGDAARWAMNGDIVSAPRERNLSHYRSVGAQEKDAKVTTRAACSRDKGNVARRLPRRLCPTAPIRRTQSYRAASIFDQSPSSSLNPTVRPAATDISPIMSLRRPFILSKTSRSKRRIVPLRRARSPADAIARFDRAPCAPDPVLDPVLVGSADSLQAQAHRKDF